MENKFTPEMLEKLKEAIAMEKSTEEILAIAKESGIELSAEKAEELFARYHKSCDLSDDELDNVSGGINNTTTVPCDPSKETGATGLLTWYCPYCGECLGRRSSTDTSIIPDDLVVKHILACHPERYEEYLRLDDNSKWKNAR